jgi:hypothetical protein
MTCVARRPVPKEHSENVTGVNDRGMSVLKVRLYTFSLPTVTRFGLRLSLAPAAASPQPRA